jgi:hypothetical protein
MASDAMRTAIERHYGVRLVFQNCHRAAVFRRSTGFPVPVIRGKGKLPAGVTFRAARNGTATLSGVPAKSAADTRSS